MEITGRLTADAKTATLKDGREVVNFSIAINDRHKPKGQTEVVKKVTYVSCSYWNNATVAGYILYKAYEDVHKHRSSWYDFQRRYIIRTERKGRTVDRFKFGEVVFDIFDVSTNVTWKKVQGARSPFDGDTEYWSTRNSILSGAVSEKIYRKQNGICPFCNQKLQWYESWERHRKNKDKLDNRQTNIQLVHLRCHRKELYRIK